jgi:hypothetical protein
LGKDNVEQRQINLIAVLVEFCDGLFAIARGKNRVAKCRQSLAGKLAKPFMVLGNEDEFGSAADGFGILGLE